MVQNLVIEYLQGKEENFEKILNFFRSGIEANVQRRLNRGQKFKDLDKDDLIQELQITLYNTLQYYDPNKGVKFNTYFWNSVENRWIQLTKRGLRQKRNDIDLYIDELQEKDENFDIGLVDEIYDDIELNLTIINHKELSKQEKELCIMLARGIEKSVIAKKWNVSKQRISNMTRKIRKKFAGRELELIF